MPLIPLEDNFADIINKAQRGRQIADERLAMLAGVSMEDLMALKAGKPLIPVLRRVARHVRLNPNALEALARQQWFPKLPAIPRSFSMFTTQLEDMTVNSYLFWDERSKHAVAIDTGANADEMVDFIKTEKLVLRYVLLTHSHRDHVGGLEALVAQSNPEVWIHEAELASVPNAKPFKDGAYFHVGEAAIKALHIGGHSPGLSAFSVTGLSQPVVCTGDALFAGSMGGCEQGYESQRQNIWNRVLSLTKETCVAPGHGPLSTIIQEKNNNPFFN